MEELAAIEQRLTGAGSEGHLNEVARLYELCESADLTLMAEALKAISRVLSHQRKRVSSATADVDGESPIVGWLQRHTEAYHAALARLATSANPRAQVCALRLSMAAIRVEAEESRPSARLGGGKPAVVLPSPERRVKELLTELLLHKDWFNHVAQCLMDEFVKCFVDVRHYVYSHLRFCCDQVGRVPWSLSEGAPEEPAAKKRRRHEVAPFVEIMRKKGRTPEELFTRVLSLLTDAPDPVKRADNGGDKLTSGGTKAKGEEEEAAFASVLAPTGLPVASFLRQYRKLYQEAWLQLLSLHVPLDQCTPVLQLIPSRVMPHLSCPLMLADFYLRAFHSGSLEVSVASLSGLLFLLTRHGLGDPETLSSSSQEYYTQLYSLIKPETFKLRRRARFQRLVAASLDSGLLPARFAAVFAKRCLRTAVACTDPGAVMWLLAVAYSLIQKHHSHCRYLLHQDPVEGSLEVLSASDCFDATAPLPMALEQAGGTSMWELQALRRHYVPSVQTLAKLFLRPFFKPTSKKLDPQLFLDQTFEKLYGQALRVGERQVARLEARGENCPVAFVAEDDPLAARVFGWAAALSTSQRKIGAGL